MSTITLPNIRVGSDLQVRVRLKDGGVAIDWSTLSNIKACIYSDAQRALAGRCAFSIDEEDNTLLVCTYAANKPQYLGVNRIVISAKYMGETKTYDKPAFTFVRWTADQEGEEITIDDPDVDVEIDVEDISSSILQEAVDAAFTAADRANDAAAAAEHMVDIHTGPEGKSAYEVAVDEGYTGTEEEWLASLVGPQGAQGIQGETGEAAGFGSVSAALQEDGGDPSVVVAASGEDTSKNFAFTFKNLKGDKGDKGDQGNTGSSVDYPYELVNNLTTNDATKGLTAAMGVQLEGEVSQLEAKVDELDETVAALPNTINNIPSGTYNELKAMAQQNPSKNFAFMLVTEDFKKPVWHLGGKFYDAVGANINLDPADTFVFKVIAIADNDTFSAETTRPATNQYIPDVNCDFYIDWGDGSPIEHIVRANISHQYQCQEGDIFTVTITGYLPLFVLTSSSEALKRLYSIEMNTLSRATHFNANQFGVELKLSNPAQSQLVSLSADAFNNVATQDRTTLILCCPKMTSVPDSLFDGWNLVSASDQFYKMTELTKFPSSFKAAIKNCVRFFDAFRDAFWNMPIENFDYDIFDEVEDGSVLTFQMAFSRFATGIASEIDAYELYRRMLPKCSSDCITTNCFYNSGFKNLDQVPTTWGGSLTV